MANPQFGFSDELKYGFDDPETAMRNALQDQGYNPYSANPFMDMFMRAAPGLRTSYAIERLHSAGPGNIPSMQGNESFGGYLRNQIGQGSIYHALQHGQDRLPGTVNMLRGYQGNLAAGRQGTNTNPFAAYLDDLFKEGDGAGLTNSILAMRAPQMGSTQLASAYRSALDAAQQGGVRRFANESNMGRNGDVWRYILGF